MKEKLLLISSILFVFIILVFFLSKSFALFLYDYSSGIMLGTSEGKVITILLWMLFTFFLGWVSVKREWKTFSFKFLFPLFIILMVLLFSINIVAFNSMLIKAEASPMSERNMVLVLKPESPIILGYSRLEHTHSLKPVLYTFFSSFTDVESSSYDWGGSLYEFSADWIFYPTVLLVGMSFIVYCLLIVHIAEASKGILILFNLFVFGLASLSFFVAIFDAGLFSSSVGTGITLLSVYFLFNYINKKEFKLYRIPILIILPLVVLAVFNLLTHLVANTYPVGFESHLIVSAFCLVSTILYASFYRFKYRYILLSFLVFLLAFNLFSFKPYAFVQKSIRGDEVYMLVPSYLASKEEILRRLDDFPYIINLKTVAEYEQVLVIKGDVTKTGLTTTYLAEELIDRKLTPMASNLIFAFADPKQKWNFTICIQDNQINESDIIRLNIIGVDPFDINSIENKNNMVEINYTSPAGIDWRHFITILNEDMDVSHIIIPRESYVKSSGEFVKDFFFTMIPTTSIQIKAYEVFR